MLNQNADADSMGGPGDDEASLPFEDGRSGSSNSGATISSSSSSSSSSKRSKKKAMKSLSDLLDVDDDGSSRRPQSQPPVLGSAMVTRKVRRKRKDREHSQLSHQTSRRVQGHLPA